MFTPELRRRLSEIARGKAAAVGQPPESPAPPDCPVAFDLSGEEWRNELGPFFVYTCRASEVIPDWKPVAVRASSAIAGMGHDPCGMLFVDLETCGLAGVPVFLVGTMRISGDDCEIVQFFARDYSEEESMLLESRKVLESAGGVITFNGRAFDLPFLRDRMTRHKLGFDPPRVHIDMLHIARRKWKGTLPNCKLQTLESCICRRRRYGDVPGSEIPGVYHDFVKSGDISSLIPVLKHNVLDLVTTAELIGASDE